jgi:hypothetical protein
MASNDPFPPHTQKQEESQVTNSDERRITPLEGTTTVDEKVFIESETLAYFALDKVCAQIAQEVYDTRAWHVVLLNDAMSADIQNYFAVLTELKILEKSYASLVSKQLSMTGSAAAIGPAIELLGLFRESTSFSGRKFEIQERPLMAALAGKLITKKISVRMPALFPVGGVAGPDSVFANVVQPLITDIRRLQEQLEERYSLPQPDSEALPSGWQQLLSALQSLANRLASVQQELMKLAASDTNKPGKENSPADRVAELFQPVLVARRDAMGEIGPKLRQIAELDEELGRLEKGDPLDPAKIAMAREKIAGLQSELRPALVLLEKTDSQFTELQNSMSKVEEKSGLSRFARLVRASEILGRKEAAFLYASVVSAGGAYRVSRNLLQTMFWKGNWSFSGGCIVWYTLFGADGTILASAIHRHLEPFTSLKSPGGWRSWLGKESTVLNSTQRGS